MLRGKGGGAGAGAGRKGVITGSKSGCLTQEDVLRSEILGLYK